MHADTHEHATSESRHATDVVHVRSSAVLLLLTWQGASDAASAHPEAIEVNLVGMGAMAFLQPSQLGFSFAVEFRAAPATTV